MMRAKNSILLTIIACISGIAFFFACKYIYESKLSELKKKAKDAFVEAVDQEVKKGKMEGSLMFALPDVANLRTAELPDSVYVQILPAHISLS